MKVGFIGLGVMGRPMALGIVLDLAHGFAQALPANALVGRGGAGEDLSGLVRVVEGLGSAQ